MIPLLPLLLVGALAAPAPSCAVCTCAPPGDAPVEEQVESAVEAADAVFTGRVVRIDGLRATSTPYVDVVVAVAERWKGEVADTVVVRTARLGPMCGAHFTQGKPYLVYAYRAPTGGLSTSSCSRTARTRRAEEDLRVLAELRRAGALEDRREAAESS